MTLGPTVDHWKDLATWGATFVTFILGVAGLLVALVGNRKTRFITTVTNQRVLWIEQLRQDLAKFVGLAGVMIYDTSADKVVASSLENRLELSRLRRVITLRLNPSGVADGRIESLLPAVKKAAFAADITFAEEALDELTHLAQDLLKTEWEKVKGEAERGRLAKPECLAKADGYLISLRSLSFGRKAQ
jgi:hypothetical protein